MLKKIISYSDCKDCRFCCSFRRFSLWETPYFPVETAKKLDTGNVFSYTKVNGTECAKPAIENKYKTQDGEEEVPCCFLNENKGCILNEEDKPFDCKIWPLRVMKKDSGLVIALTPTCPTVNKAGLEKITKLVKDELSKTIFDYALSHPYIIKEYKDGFPVLDNIKK